MKKRILAIVFVIALAAASLFALAACNDSNGDWGLVYDKKYIDEDYVHDSADSQQYYVFHKSGYCEYRYARETTHDVYVPGDNYDGDYEKVGTIKYDYTVEYRYTYVDEDKSAIVFFYNGVKDNSTYTDLNGKATPLKDSEWYKNKGDEYLPSASKSGLLTVSKNVLCSAGTYGYQFFVNEDYVKSIPNFNPNKAVEEK